jgi:hypothetical protein
MNYLLIINFWTILFVISGIIKESGEFKIVD